MSRTSYLKIFNYDNQSCSRKYKLLLHPFASNFYLTSNTHRRFWGCRDPAADRNLVLTFYFGLALPTLSTVLTVYTQTANRVVLLWCSQITQLYVNCTWIILTTSGVLSPRSTVDSDLLTLLGSAWICDLHEFKRNYSTNTMFVKFNPLTT